MILIYMLACRSVGGSEGFVIHDAMLFHLRGSESVEESGAYEKQHSGVNVLLAWGGGECPYYNSDSGRPDGEGWERSQDEHYTDEERCAWFNEVSMYPDSSWVMGAGVYRRSLNVYIEDGIGLDAAGNPGWNGSTTIEAKVTKCVRPTEADMEYDWETVDFELDSADLKIHGDKGHITAKAGSKLVVDLTLPLCLVDY